MQLAKVGFITWFSWAFFSWKGRMKRLPFAVASLCLYLLLVPYVPIAAQTLAVYFMPPAGGGSPDLEYVRTLANSVYMVPLLLPVCYMRLCLDFKRLRSIEAPLLIALPFVGLLLFSPVLPPDLGQMSTLTIFAYLGIMAIIPAKEDRVSPHERKYRTWQAISTGDNKPIRLRGKDIKGWRIVRQGPAKE